ncbi:transcription factor [Ganoderma sinense ZZ0214-1]|uniref:Transcription factor n=1 Tax=Ganoderma sinense ZZ0214-1 TaxID=1077348 RepID=A0A2G8RRV4_9APHY|nr:transcription factor [Ganoderma sinense ZZ0214-1]
MDADPSRAPSSSAPLPAASARKTASAPKSESSSRKPRKSKLSSSSPSQNQTEPRPPPSLPSPTSHSPPPASDPRTSRISNIRDQPLQSSARFAAPLQPYSGAPPAPTVTAGPPYSASAMNPSYPMNGSPYPSSPSPFHQPTATGSPANGQSANVTPTMPTHSGQYQYPPAVHHQSYGHHPYPSYPQYAPGMMMYQAQPGAHPESTQSASNAPPPAMGKRKRKYAHDGVSSRVSDEEGADSSTDIQRVASGSAAALVDSKKRTKTQRACDSCRSRKIRCDILADTDPPVCQHCKQYSFECTFFLPITETRFKKKKLEEEAAAAAAVAEKDKEAAERSTSSPQAEHPKTSGVGDIKVFGPTSTTHLLHSHPLVASRTYEAYDLRYHHSWDLSADGDGIIRVHEPEQGELQLALPKPIDLRIERDVVERLVNSYFVDVAPLLPVVTREEFIANNPPPPILLYSICLVAATRRDVPQKVFESIRYTVNSLIKAEDVLSTASIVNMQSLLILAMVGDCHSQYVPHALSALWVRLGCAIRMAQDLGLHRAESVKQNIEMRRRLWGVCVISDRWISLTFGHPFMIDIRDCDARLPSSGDPNDLYMDELVRLSVILGRVQKTIYTPAGLTFTNDEELHKLLSDLETWKSNLPEDLQFRGPETPMSAALGIGRGWCADDGVGGLGMLFLFYTTVNMIFWRVFMRISYSCPAHLKFSLTVEKWTGLVQMSGDAIDWLDAHEDMYDVWLLVPYCATSFALVQTAEIISLLYEATQAPMATSDVPLLNPTGGVKGRTLVSKLSFQKDSTRPGGGVFIAKGAIDQELQEKLPQGTIVPGGESDEGEAPGASTAPEANDDGLQSSVPPPVDRTARSRHGTSDSWLTPPPPSGPAPMVVDSAGATHGRRQPRQQHMQSGVGQAGSSMVNFSQLGDNFPNMNMNPALNDQMSAPENVHVMNVLDQTPSMNGLEQQAMADVGFLEGIPGAMFDWGQWENFFSRFNPQLGSQMGGFQQHQRMGDGMGMGSQPSPQDAAAHAVPGGTRYFPEPDHGL